jgi:dCMP deaminase
MAAICNICGQSLQRWEVGHDENLCTHCATSTQADQEECQACQGSGWSRNLRYVCLYCLGSGEMRHVGNGIKVPAPKRTDPSQSTISNVADLKVTVSAEIPPILRAMPAEGQLSRSRPSWDTYYLQLAQDAAARVTCPAGQVGCIVVSPEGVPLIFGYNGAPSGISHCDEAAAGCTWVERWSETEQSFREYPRHVHAEANAISRAARVGARLGGATMYITQEPCPECLKLCMQAGLTGIVVGSVRDRKWYDEAAGICASVGIALREGQA